MRLKKEKKHSICSGQSMIEYMIMLAAVMLFLFLITRPGGMFERSYNRMTESQSDHLHNMANRIFN